MYFLNYLYWILFFGFIGFALTVLLRKWYLSRHNEATTKRATRAFRMHGNIRGWKTFEKVTLGSGDTAVVVDQLVVAPFGVIVACDLHQKGSVYGDMDAERWVISDGGEDRKEKKREYIASPYHRARLAEQQLRKLFAKEKIYSVPVEIIIPKTMNQTSYITGSSELLIDTRKLKKQLEKVRYEKNSGVDVARIAALFSAG